MSPSAVEFPDLGDADLGMETIYRGGSRGNSGDDPLHPLLGVGNMGGFRFLGSVQRRDVRLVVLYSTGTDPDWPDLVDPVTGDFTYYGDNKQPGTGLHDTPRGGNGLLRWMFELSRGSSEDRSLVPPIFLFEKAGQGRDVRFRGLLAPGSPRLSAEDELVAVWRTTRERRFQNYRSHFTVLNVDPIPRAWIEEVKTGDRLGAHCPPGWRRWVRGRIYDALEAPRTMTVRSKIAQYPDGAGMEVLRAVYQRFQDDSTGFEHFAADIWLHSDPNVDSVDVTRPTRDGGRDATGSYAVGPKSDPVKITFALEAKCYRPLGNSVGVKELSRLISRIKHRDFGVLVTTAHVGDQPYREIREDQHPIVLITGRDIVTILATMGYRSLSDVQDYLTNGHPRGADPAMQESRPDIAHAESVALSVEPEDLSSARSAPADLSRRAGTRSDRG